MRSARNTLRTLVLVLAPAAMACQAAPTTRARDAAPDLPTFDVSPLDGATAGYALSFDGVRQYATAGDPGFAPVGGPMTIELWINYAAANGTQDFLAMRTSLPNGSESGVRVGIHNGALAVWRAYVDRVLVQAPATPPAGTWHHLAYTFDATTNLFYVDGALVDNNTNVTDTHTPMSVWLGTFDGYDSLFRGELDEVRVWTVTRSASEIAADKQHSSEQTAAGLVAYWTFDDAQNIGRSVDMSQHGSDVTFGDGVAAYMPLRVPSFNVPSP